MVQITKNNFKACGLNPASHLQNRMIKNSTSQTTDDKQEHSLVAMT